MARRRRDGRRESNKQQIFVISPSVSLRSTAPSTRERILLYGLRLSVNVNLILYRRDRACPCPQPAKVGRAVACCRRQITTNQRLHTIIFLYYTVGANCVRPFLICYELAGDRRSPLSAQITYKIKPTGNRLFRLPLTRELLSVAKLRERKQ